MYAKRKMNEKNEKPRDSEIVDELWYRLICQWLII